MSTNQRVFKASTTATVLVLAWLWVFWLYYQFADDLDNGFYAPRANEKAEVVAAILVIFMILALVVSGIVISIFQIRCNRCGEARKLLAGCKTCETRTTKL